jgi:hypothetical protein
MGDMIMSRMDLDKDLDQDMNLDDTMPALPPSNSMEEEEKKELEDDPPSLRSSVRGPLSSSATKSTSTNANTASNKRPGNRGSLDGTRRFRKVVTFRSSMSKTRLIPNRAESERGRVRGRNSFLPWFSQDSQSHVQETLTLQEQIRHQEREEKKAKRLKNKAEQQQKKLAKKIEKEEKKKKKKEEKKTIPKPKPTLKEEESIPFPLVALRNHQHDHGSSLDDGPLIFEDGNNLDSSINVEDLLNQSSYIARNTAVGNHSTSKASLHESIPVRRSAQTSNSNTTGYSRRRSSVTTAILRNMGRWTKKTSRPKHTMPMPDHNDASDNQAYDWTSHAPAPSAKSLHSIAENN